jgi:hypothetical protein
MADAIRNFDEEYEFDKVKPVVFILGGKTLHAKPILHPSLFLSRKEGETGIESAVRIIMGSLIDADKKVFQALIDDPNIRISANQVDDIATWLLEVASGGRPTKSRPTSGNGAAKTGTGSKATSSATVKLGKK